MIPIPPRVTSRGKGAWGWNRGCELFSRGNCVPETVMDQHQRRQCTTTCRHPASHYPCQSGQLQTFLHNDAMEKRQSNEAVHHCWWSTCTGGLIGARNIAQCHQYPAFPPFSPAYGCGGTDAAPQAHVRLAKKVYPQKRKVMGYPAIPGAPFDLPHRGR